MSPKSLAWIVLGGCAFALGGLELAACSDSGGGTGTPTGGNDATVGKDGQSSGDGSSGGDGSSKNDGSSVQDAGVDCGKAPTLHPRGVADGGDGGPIMNFLCPFSAPTGQPWDYCNSGTEHCCIPFAKGAQSTCEATCPNEADGGPFDGRDFACLDNIDCLGGGKVCCGIGQVLKDDACGTYFGKGFKGSVCKTSCDTNNNEFPICQSDDQCTGGKTCTPMSAVGAQFGFCQ